MNHDTDDEPQHSAIHQLHTLAAQADIAAAVLASLAGNSLAAVSHNPLIDTGHIASLSAMLASLHNDGAQPDTAACRKISLCDLGGSPMAILAFGPVLLTVLGRDGSNREEIAATATEAARKLAEAINFPVVAAALGVRPEKNC